MINHLIKMIPVYTVKKSENLESDEKLKKFYSVGSQATISVEITVPSEHMSARLFMVFIYSHAEYFNFTAWMCRLLKIYK